MIRCELPAGPKKPFCYSPEDVRAHRAVPKACDGCPYDRSRGGSMISPLEERSGLAAYRLHCHLERNCRISKHCTPLKQQHSALVHPIVTMLLLFKDQFPRLPFQPLLTSRQIQEVLVRPLYIYNLDFLRLPFFGDHVCRGDEV